MSLTRKSKIFITPASVSQTVLAHGIPQCHLLQGTSTTDSAALLSPVDFTFLTCSKDSFPSTQIPAHFVTMPVSLALFCAVLVVIALHHLFPTLILPFMLGFFLWVGVVEPCWFLRHDYSPCQITGIIFPSRRPRENSLQSLPMMIVHWLEGEVRDSNQTKHRHPSGGSQMCCLCSFCWLWKQKTRREK